MKKGKRAERRHHNARLLKKRFKREVREYYPFHDEDRDEVLSGCLHRARRRLDTNCACSCSICGNPRRHYGTASWNVLTFQERRAIHAQRDGMQEVEDEGLTAG